jgi:hypothetical protein
VNLTHSKLPDPDGLGEAKNTLGALLGKVAATLG